MHYCMGQLADWGLGTSNSKICGNCGMKESDEKDNGCCKDKHVVVKNNVDQKFAETGLSKIQVLAVALPVSFIEVHFSNFLSVTEENSGSHAPPRSTGVAVYIRNCIFLI